VVRDTLIAMQWVDRGGVRVAYDVHNPAGPGPGLLLSHGFGATSGMWRLNVPALSAGRMVVAWDQRGHGESDAPADPDRYGHEICLGDMAAILDTVGAERAVLVGMSLGGYLSLQFTMAHPERVAALVLVDTGPGFRRDEARQQWNDRALSTADAIERTGELGPSSSERTEARHRDIRGVARAARKVLTQVDGRVIDALPGIAVPTLIVVGADDTNFIASADYMERVIPGARKVVIPDAGHAANLDQPEIFNAAVLDFLGSTVDSAGIVGESA
jgi:pimeloyl-ACP methyl ester carboxylesterase